jgi:hypothetical protein
MAACARSALVPRDNAGLGEAIVEDEGSHKEAGAWRPDVRLPIAPAFSGVGFEAGLLPALGSPPAAAMGPATVR